MERWRAVPGYEGRYWISDQGRVRSFATGTSRLLAGFLTHDGYRSVELLGVTHRVHRLVLLAFDRAPLDGEEVRHLNGDPDDNRLINLAWGTHAENMADRVRHGTDRNAQKTHCPRGHLLDDVGRRSNGRTYRRCSICREASQRRSNAKRDYSTITRPRATCPHCNVEMRADSIPLHRRRKHEGGVAA